MSFRGEESPVYRFVGPPQQQPQAAQEGGSGVGNTPSPSKRGNSFAALDMEGGEDEGDGGLDPKVAARMRRLHALVGASSGFGDEEEASSAAPGASSSSASTQGEAASGGETSTNELWSMLAGMTPPPAGAAPASQPAAAAAPLPVATAVADDDVEEEEDEAEAQDFGWSAALSASVTPGTSGAAAPEDAAEEEQEASTQSGRPPLPPQPAVKPAAKAAPAPASSAGKAKAKQQKQGGADGAGEESWPWSVGLDHRLKERAPAPGTLPPTPPPSRASSTSSLATLPGAGVAAANTSVEAGVGAKLLRKMGWQPEGVEAGTQLSSLPPAATAVPLPRPERLGLGVPTPAEQAARAAATAELEAVAGGNSQKKVALMMGGASAQPADAAWEDSGAQRGKGGTLGGNVQASGHSEAQPPESWEQAAVVVASSPGGDAGGEAMAPVVAMKKLLLAHLRGMEDSLEVAASDAVKQGTEEGVTAVLRKMQKVLDLMQGEAWRNVTYPQ